MLNPATQHTLLLLKCYLYIRCSVLGVVLQHYMHEIIVVVYCKCRNFRSHNIRGLNFRGDNFLWVRVAHRNYCCQFFVCTNFPGFNFCGCRLSTRISLELTKISVFTVIYYFRQRARSFYLPKKRSNPYKSCICCCTIFPVAVWVFCQDSAELPESVWP